ncbi:aminotransferase class V-fold PLP-dependent enzyme [Deltaproteobacteria bacterium]|nr:aminotransferase class V-fold PLP-dependent enzyme [Deltaproteobacteria bacterium]
MDFNPAVLALEFSILKSSSDKGPLHYLDNAAMTQVPDCVIEAIVEHETRCRSNVKRALHSLAEAATDAFEAARSRVADYLGVNSAQEIIFTSGTTAGINMLALSLGHNLKPGDEILLSHLEHHSNIVPWHMLKQQRGVSIRYLPVTDDGRLDLDSAEDLITDRTRLGAVRHGSNVTGAITDVMPLARLAHDKGASLMLDGAQVAPQGPLDLPSLDVDFYVFSGHKVYGPSGIGVLWGKRDLLEKLPPALGGGEMISHVSLDKSSFLNPPHRFEAGTPPVTQAVGLGASLEWLGRQDLSGLHGHLNGLIEKIMEGLNLLDGGLNRIRVLGPALGENRLPLVSFAVRDIHPHDICQVLNDRHGVALRGGYHCAEPLHELWNLDGSTRASLAAFNLKSDVDAFLNGMEDCMKLLSQC